ncbi:MAG: YggS family pyridoxal phosphate-dependent enzyme [Gammaproteobacteria bacterium]|nr:MAG: YggS family pyridoxal phosphate-dependent enzyme [Gammaproteobacteria bacterium]UCH39488.1 MAG: YggS family pyridoxal phosphate-dependent enzyme [Gammaproteobacteria bacterium]
MQNIGKNLNRIHAQIAQAAEACQRDPKTILLLAVSKQKPASDIRVAYELGQKHFGENYLQEALQKMQELSDLDICWHFIGAIQSNKTRSIAEAFDWAHCIDRVKIARRLSEQRPAGKPPLNVCIQVNIDHEESKAGIELDAVVELAASIHELPGIRLRGLMTIPAPRPTFDQQRLAFAQLAETLATLKQQGIDCDTLSMGMTQDMDAAIAEGSTLVRIGTAIFGERT